MLELIIEKNNDLKKKKKISKTEKKSAVGGLETSVPSSWVQ